MPVPVATFLLTSLVIVATPGTGSGTVTFDDVLGDKDLAKLVDDIQSKTLDTLAEASGGELVSVLTDFHDVLQGLSLKPPSLLDGVSAVSSRT